MAPASSSKKRTRGAKKEEPKTQYLVSRVRADDVIIEIPSSWKVTFSGVNPQHASRHEGFALRLYEGTKLRAVIAECSGFRDLSIPLARKVTRETGSAEWTKDSSGNFEETRSISVDHQLVGSDDDFEDIPF